MTFLGEASRYGLYSFDQLHLLLKIRTSFSRCLYSCESTQVNIFRNRLYGVIQLIGAAFDYEIFGSAFTDWPIRWPSSPHNFLCCKCIILPFFLSFSFKIWLMIKNHQKCWEKTSVGRMPNYKWGEANILRNLAKDWIFKKKSIHFEKSICT